LLKTPSNGFVAFVAGLALTAAAALPISFAEFLLIPGVVIAFGVGAGTIHEPGKAGPVLTLALIYLGSLAAWVAISYGLLRLFGRRRAA
jgi:hypothetical protein